ncbi:MAG: hypothetical protein WAW51_12700, partial [Ilumatobacteraceae bacterium]
MATVAVVLEPVRGRVGEVPEVSPTSLVGVASSAAAGDEAVSAAVRLNTTLNGVCLQALYDPEAWPAERQRAAIEAALTAGSL